MNTEQKEDVKEINDESSQSSIELPNPKKEKKPYVLTPARQAQFEKARVKRQENIEIRKKEKEEQDGIKKKELENKILIKAKRISKKQEKVEKVLQLSDNDKSDNESSRDEEVIVKKVTKPKKKKIIVVESESDDEPQIVFRKREKAPIQPVIKKIVPLFI